MKWSKDRPTQPGWYWEYQEGYRRVIEVFAWNGRRGSDTSKALWTKERGVLLAVDDWPETRWAGPIPPPDEP